MRLRLRVLAMGLALSVNLYSQDFYFGNDLSYVNMMVDCGAVFREEGVDKDVYKIFADHGCNLVRVRLWKDPSWQDSLDQPDGVKPQYNNFEDARECIARSKAAGMQVMLGLHFSDFWADPGKQIIPSDWVGVADNTTLLGDSVYNYVIRVLTDLDKDGLMPEIIKVGNENNPGILKHTTLNPDWSAGGTVSNSWSRHAVLFNRAIQAIRDISDTSSIKPRIALHFAGLNGAEWWYQNIINNGVKDFDIIGLSYYYAWHGGSIPAMGNTIKSLKNTHPGYEVMIVEMGYLWTTQNHDSMGNIVTIPDPEYLPVIPEKQLEYLV
ncbi:MAG: glycosyl hydrolase 53 family protein, partial [Bacteroidales bacterium]|nr:glycosyl hydrolase 53 family protein [Bacteroidales bacterium]